MGDIFRITVYDGKYTVVLPEGGGLHVLRYGEEWRDCTGDGLILALASRVDELQKNLEEARKENSKHLKQYNELVDIIGYGELDTHEDIVQKLIEKI